MSSFFTTRFGISFVIAIQMLCSCNSGSKKTATTTSKQAALISEFELIIPKLVREADPLSCSISISEKSENTKDISTKVFFYNLSSKLTPTVVTTTSDLLSAALKIVPVQSRSDTPAEFLRGDKFACRVQGTVNGTSKTTQLSNELQIDDVEPQRNSCSRRRLSQTLKETYILLTGQIIAYDLLE